MSPSDERLYRLLTAWYMAGGCTNAELMAAYASITRGGE